MQLHKVDDPRDAYDRIRRKEAERLAKIHGIKEIKQGMPAILMRRYLRQYRVPIPQEIAHRPLGQPGLNRSIDPSNPRPVQAVNEVRTTTDAEAILEQEWEDARSMADLRKECKAKGITLSRTDKKEDLLRKLDGDTS